VHGFKTYVQVEIKDKTGKTVKRTRKKLCKSYTRQMIDLLLCVGTSENVPVTRTDSNSDVIDFIQSGTLGFLGRMIAESGNDLFGIQVGIGTDEPYIDCYQLTTQIAHGDGSGELSYGTTSISEVALVGNMAKITIARPFTNNSGSNIDVTEVGLVIACEDSAPTLIYLLIERSLLSFTVANGTSGTVTYTLSVTA
jgi:hypothetical protein